jgi:hypothetical protein
MPDEPIVPVNPLRFAVLSALRPGPLEAGRLRDRLLASGLEPAAGERPWFGVTRRLVRDGLLAAEPAPVPPRGGSAPTVFRLTPAGHATWEATVEFHRRFLALAARAS